MWLVLGMLHLVRYLWEATREFCVCVCICVNSGFSPYKPLSEAQRLDVTLALVKMWLLEREKESGRLRFSSPQGILQARTLSVDDKID